MSAYCLFLVPRVRVLLFCAAAFLFGWMPLSVAEEVSRTPPEIFGKRIEPLLTPLDEVLSGKHDDLGKDEDGIDLLVEQVQFVDESDHRWIAYQYCYKAVTQAGVEEIAESTFDYRKANQQIYLV